MIENDGIIELIASPRLNEDDVEAINDGLKRREDVIKDVLLRELKDPKGKFEEARLNLLSNLIAAGKLKIKIALLESESEIGMFHEKVGIMYDKDNNAIAFSGSMNESYNAFATNYEAIDVFTSWSKDEDRVLNKETALNSLWNDYEPGVIVREFPDISDEIVKKYKINDKIDTSLDHYNNIIFVDNSKTDNRPFIPDKIQLREYQIDAIKEWKKRGYRGIFDMATGTGKTYTSLAAVAELYSDKRKLAVIIVCPYQHLVEQWKEDIVLFGMKPIICYSSSSQKDWKERLKRSVNGFKRGIIEHFCMVSTNATFSTDYVQDLIGKLSDNVLLVVDEAHNFGAEKLSKALSEKIPYRLALSATIDRHGDDEGTQRLYSYFGEKCIEYTLKDAIDNDMLTPYYYYPIVVSLSEAELEMYLELTAKIVKNLHKDEKGKIRPSEYAKTLLIKRARLVAGAVEKIEKLRESINEYKDDNQILVYCGATTVNDDDYQEGIASTDEKKQINIVADMLGNEMQMRVSKFTSEEDSDERERIKAAFSEGSHLQVLVAIRCLDEGVNIPSIRTAFILASSTNPKEYIQRRGRVLRKYPGKKHATIYDFVTLPIPLEKIEQYNSDIIGSVRSLAMREIERVKEFASIAMNPYKSDSLIAEIRRKYNISTESEENSDYEY